MQWLNKRIIQAKKNIGTVPDFVEQTLKSHLLTTFLEREITPAKASEISNELLERLLADDAILEEK